MPFPAQAGRYGARTHPRGNTPTCLLYFIFFFHPLGRLLRDKIDEMERKVLYLEKNPLQLLNPSYGRDINEIKGTLSGISFTLVRYIQLASDINEKIKISNELAQSNYPQLAEKFEQYNKQYDSLVNRIDLLDSTLSVSDLDVRGGNENNLRKSSSSFTLSSEVSGEGSGQQSEQQSGQQGGQQSGQPTNVL